MIIKKVAAPKNTGNFKSLAQYITNSQNKENRILDISFSNIDNVDPEDMSAGNVLLAINDVRAIQYQNKKAKSDKSYHMVISFQRGEKPTKSQLKNIEKEVCKALGFDEHQRISAVHGDTENLHIHIAINKINPTTLKIREPKKDFIIMGKIAQKLEKKYHLIADNHEKKNAQNKAKELENKTGELSFLSYMKSISKELEQAKDWKQFNEVCKTNGVILQRKGNGLVFKSTGEKKGTAKASDVNRAFSKSKLEKKYGEFKNLESKFKESSSTDKERTYKAQPTADYARNKELSDKLFSQFQDYKKSGYEQARRERARIKQEQQREIESLINNARGRKSAFTRNFLKYSGFNLKAEIEQVKRAAQLKLLTIQKPENSFKAWLKTNANRGNKEAKELLLLKQKYQDRKKATVLRENVNNGKVIFEEDGSIVTEKSKKLFLNEKPSDKAMLFALLNQAMTKDRPITVSGDEQFKKRLVGVAIKYQINIKFADSEMESLRVKGVGLRAGELKFSSVDEFLKGTKKQSKKRSPIHDNSSYFDDKYEQYVTPEPAPQEAKPEAPEKKQATPTAAEPAEPTPEQTKEPQEQPFINDYVEILNDEAPELHYEVYINEGVEETIDIKSIDEVNDHYLLIFNKQGDDNNYVTEISDEMVKKLENRRASNEIIISDDNQIEITKKYKKRGI